MRISAANLPDLSYLQLDRARNVFYQLTPAELVEAALQRNEGVLADTGALAIDSVPGHHAGQYWPADTE